MITKNNIAFAVLIFCLLAVVGCSSEKKKEHIEYNEKTVVFEERESVASQLERLKKDGFETFDYVDAASGDTVIMQQYFMAFLMRADNTTQTEAELTALQNEHMAHLGRMYEEGFADISGPFGDDTDMRGITIYNVPTLAIADSLANLDPMVKAGRLRIEIKPWWAGKGNLLR